MEDCAVILSGAGCGIALFSLLGAVPRAGPLRALILGLRSYFMSTCPLSVRACEINLLKESLLSIERGSYIVVIGGKGSGKSCLIDTALRQHCGVVRVTTESGAGKDVIVKQVIGEIAGIRSKHFNPEGSARRSLFFYSLLFKRSPIAVIRVPERLAGQQYADLPSAARALADEYGLRVVVDGTPNSIPPELLRTKRQTVIAVAPMSREQIESVPELKDLLLFLSAHRLDDAAWKIGRCWAARPSTT